MTYRQHDKKTNMTETQNDKKTKMRKDKKTKTKKREYYCNVLKVFSNYRVGRHNFTPKKTSLFASLVTKLHIWSQGAAFCIYYGFGQKGVPPALVTNSVKRHHLYYFQILATGSNLTTSLRHCLFWF